MKRSLLRHLALISAQSVAMRAPAWSHHARRSIGRGRSCGAFWDRRPMAQLISQLEASDLERCDAFSAFTYFSHTHTHIYIYIVIIDLM